MESNFIVSTEYDGEIRRLYISVCIVCGKNTWIPKRFLASRKYCSKECNRIGKTVEAKTLICNFCKSEFKRKKNYSTRSGLVFCDRLCKEKAQSVDNNILVISHYQGGRRNYRERAFREYGSKCDECGYDELEEMLDVDHIDGNRSHNEIKNLQVLCVWCHAYKTRVIEKWNKSKIIKV